MTKLIINADDFGYCEAVNHGIISAHKNGIVTSTTVMANMPGFEHAMSLINEYKDLKCGVHLTLSCYKPLLNNLKTIVDDKGEFFTRITNEALSKMDLDEIYMEFCAQIDRAKEHTEISHLDSHHHVHTLKGLESVIKRIVDKYNLPIRGGFEYDFDYPNIIDMTEAFYGDRVSETFFEDNYQELSKHDIVDVMCHPAFLDSFILSKTTYSINRTKEYEILTSSKVKEYVNENFTLTNYKGQ